MSISLQVGDLVWAKMKGFSPWPGRIASPTKDVKRPINKKPMQCVFFFGTNNYAWIPEESIQPYEQFKAQNIKSGKSGSFKEAIEAIDDYIKNRPASPIKTSDLPSIDEEIATIFPNGSPPAARSGPHKDYTRQPFQTKLVPKKASDSESESTSSKPAKEKVKEEPVNDSSQPEKKKVKKPGPKAGTKRVVASGSSIPAIKKIRVNDNLIKVSPVRLGSVGGFASSTPNTNSNSARKGADSLLSRPSFVARPTTPPLDVEKVTDSLISKKVTASGLKFGFLGLGNIGQGIVKNLVNSGHTITVWNRTPNKLKDFLRAGASKGQTPADVVAASDITFSCVSDPQAAKDLVFGNCGVLQEIAPGKGFIEMTSIDPETAQDVAEAITARGGRFLEAQVQGSKQAAEEGALVMLAAGDRSLFEDCYSCFQAMAKNSFYLGEVGAASKMNLVLTAVMGASVAALAESLALADRAGLQQKDVLEVLELTAMASPTIIQKGRAIVDGAYPTNMPLQHMQKDMRLALALGDQLEQPLPVSAAANEVYKHAKRLGYGEHDVSAVYIRARF